MKNVNVDILTFLGGGTGLCRLAEIVESTSEVNDEMLSVDLPLESLMPVGPCGAGGGGPLGL